MRSLLVAFVVCMQATAQSPASFRTIARGSDSKIAFHREVVARTGGWWQFIWHEHSGSFDFPTVDFSHEMVIAVFCGKAEPGASIEIVSVVHGINAIVVSYREHRTAGAPVKLPTFVTPFHIAVVPATRSSVTFVKLTAP